MELAISIFIFVCLVWIPIILVVDRILNGPSSGEDDNYIGGRCEGGYRRITGFTKKGEILADTDDY